MSSKQEGNRVHIQAWLHKQKVREADAIYAYEQATKRDKLSDRDAVREAFIAYELMRENGWQPQRLVTQIQMTEDMFQMVRAMQSLLRRLAEVDFTTARTITGEQVDFEIVGRELNEFEKNSTSMLGQVYDFDED